MFEQLIKMGMTGMDAIQLERAVERFSSSASAVTTSSAKKTIKKAEVEDEGFNPLVGIFFVLTMCMLIYLIYFTLPACMVI